MKINSSVFSKKFQILRGEATEFRTFTNPFTTRSGDIGKGFRSSFKLLCRTFLSKLESRRCKPVCYNGKCYNFCSQIRESCTYQIQVTSSWTDKFSRKNKLIYPNAIIDLFLVDVVIVVLYHKTNVNFRETLRETVRERANDKVINEVLY